MLCDTTRCSSVRCSLRLQVVVVDTEEVEVVGEAMRGEVATEGPGVSVQQQVPSLLRPCCTVWACTRVHSVNIRGKNHVDCSGIRHLLPGSSRGSHADRLLAGGLDSLATANCGCNGPYISQSGHNTAIYCVYWFQDQQCSW